MSDDLNDLSAVSVPHGSCVKCGQEHPRCSAHKKHVDPPRPCMAWPKGSAPTCENHGGKAKQVVAKAERVDAEKKAEKELTRLGLKREGLTPTALLQEAVEHRGAYLQFVAERADDPAWAPLYEPAMDGAAKVGKAGVDAGIAERAQALDEVVAVGVLEDLRASFEEVDVDPEITQRVLVALGPRLRARAIGQ